MLNPESDTYVKMALSDYSHEAVFDFKTSQIPGLDFTTPRLTKGRPQLR